MKERLTMFMISLFLFAGSALAQTKVSGTVLSQEDGQPIIGAAVKVDGTSTGMLTDVNGRFSLTMPEGKNQITVSYLGYESQTVKAKNGMRVFLKSDVAALDEVVVVAYGKATKGTYTGSAGVMKADKIEKLQVSDVSRALSGQVAGVQVTSNNGQPGTKATIRVRGVGSINAESDPLIVVDGVPFDGDLSSIATQDIENLTVLKDAASTALYGARGANGIVMITTKNGKNGKATVSFDAKWGQNSRALGNYDVIKSPAEYLEKEYEAIYNSGIYNLNMDPTAAHVYANQTIVTNENGGNGYQIYTIPEGQTLIGTNGKLNPYATLGWTNGQYYYTPDNWYDETFQKNGRQEYNISISGGTDRNSFYMSYNFLNDEGIVSGSGFKRSTVRLKDEYKVNDWMKVGANVSYVYNKSFYPDDQTTTNSSGNAFFISNGIAPIYPLYVRDAQGNKMKNGDRYVYDYGTSSDAGRDRSFMSIANPVGQMQYDHREYIMDVLNSTYFAEFTPIKGLTLTARYGINIDNTNRNELQNAYMGQFASMEGGANQTHSRTYGFDQQYIANYQFKLGEDHQFDATAGYDGYQYKYKYLYASGSKLYNPESYYVSNAVNQKNNSGYQRTYVQKGYFARLNYSYQDKYIANVAFRRDASSRFSKDNRWGNFWSASAAWLITKENFMKDIKWIDMLKFKASFGQQGNDAIGNYYAYADQYAMTGDASGFADGTLDYKGNEDLTWETSTAYNIGFDFAMFGNRLNGTIEYFGRKSSDMLYYKPVAGSLGYTQIPMNVGSMTNSGLEIDLSYDIIRTRDIKLNVNANATFMKNEINSLHEDLEGKWINGSYIYEVGYSRYRMYLPEWAGVDEETGEALYWINTFQEDADGNRVKDANGDDIITGREKTTAYTEAQKTENRVATDDLLPTVYGGFGLSLTAYGFDASIQCAYQLGGQVYDSGYQNFMHGFYTDAGENLHVDIRNAWTPTNTKTDVPRLDAQDRYANSTSTRWLTSSDYLSINNVTIGYTLPQSIISRLGLTKVRVYFAGDNLALLASRKGLDPRKGYATSNAYTYTQIRTLSGGIQVSF